MGGRGFSGLCCRSLGDVFALRGSLLPTCGCHAFFQTSPCHALRSTVGVLLRLEVTKRARSATCAPATRSLSVKGVSFTGLSSQTWPCHVIGSYKGGFFETCACHVLMSSDMGSSTVAPATRCFPITGLSSQTLALPRYRFLQGWLLRNPRLPHVPVISGRFAHLSSCVHLRPQYLQVEAHF